MSIQQALFAGSSGSAGWTLVDTWSNYAQGNSISMPTTQSGDILLAFLGRQSSSTPPSLRSGSSFAYVTSGNNGGDLTAYLIAAQVCSGSTSFNISNEFNSYDYAFFCAFRTSNAFTTTSSVVWKGSNKQTGQSSTPTHRNSIASFGMNSLALPCVWFEQTVSSPWVPPANATLVGSDNSPNGDGSVAVSSQEIDPAGSYSWGAWGDTGQFENWMAGYVEVRQP